MRQYNVYIRATGGWIGYFWANIGIQRDITSAYINWCNDNQKRAIDCRYELAN